MRFLALLTVAPRASAMLDVLAREAGLLYFGTATDNGELNNTKYVKILRDQKEWGQLTSSNGMKWFATEPEQGVFNFSMGSVVADLAGKDGRFLRCHTLVWHSQLAPWVAATNWTKETPKAAMEGNEWKGRDEKEAA
ncbi:glycosyl hydrolase family 10 [Drepanopeziza brunnea f. sp. 'multigermtubi' MB_m1]|uniref:endo-1,4-beta-xylanase n=1 Tax=Marssonina brunnea f. sp. multigermtubi (strain MB_m1) TaxID=1072389 RepID=K1Y3H7_MARBU|nr:glycosyl hydrolase family 10 [Drepanopeziza brunnea f. sp. 'multigermtubi' MB_m1]EKD19709.1 glycosyl hydrolase family 10 [Drepanopeziza brunnea f. sp. 'multigermtubi' MB_m1]